MEPEMIAVFIPIALIIGIVYLIIYVRRFENAERMAMIERGVDPSIFTKKQRSTSGALRASLLLIGGGVGLLLGYLLESSTGMEPPLPYFAMLFICGGIGLGAAYIIEENKNKQQAS
ncbi:MAG: hypothetical protein L0Y35_04185 [Flammeovirgaceae bacterium]|nr:hypothetical protein [Flammeovirgaceae bacterium]